MSKFAIQLTSSVPLLSRIFPTAFGSVTRGAASSNWRLHEVIDGVLFRTAEVSDLPQCHRLMRESFFPYHQLYQHLGIDPNTVEDHPCLTPEIIEQGLTVLAEKDKRIIGLSLHQIVRPGTPFLPVDVIKHRKDAEVLKFYLKFNESINLCRMYNVERNADALLGVVDHRTRRASVAFNGLKMTILNAAKRGMQLYSIEAENITFQRACESLGLQPVLTVKYKDYVNENGERPFAGIEGPDNDRCILYVKRL